ncbi:hypothetical protein CJF30_00001845 [Rutstroemia sp. NJR-2017a BBW]|nr:hypothetical protein CJF30_00001845 [Rutstroemia sp. NJR-2017a BBW]
MSNLSLFSSNKTNSHITSSSPTSTEPFDLICIGFGPASLAIAIALHDLTPSNHPAPRVLFLEKQPQFAWHSGMQLPSAKMQISFLKDLATPRNPRSKFTFINYLHCKNRLNTFINLSTFLPSRMEYEDYLRWCASHFEKDGCVRYGSEVRSVVPEDSQGGKIGAFEVTSSDASSGEQVTYAARNVVIAVGGQPSLPATLQNIPRVSHSSQYANAITKIAADQKASGRKLRFAVVGSGQSAAEIFNDLWERFDDAEVKLLVKGSSLRPSDDSPFVNEIFDPERTDTIFNAPAALRASSIKADRATNYGVVRLELLEHLYEKLYMQRIRCESSSTAPRAQILTSRIVTSTSAGKDGLELVVKNSSSEKLAEGKDGEDEVMNVDYVFAATGYRRDAHVRMLEGCEGLRPVGEEGWRVGRDYRVLVREGAVKRGAGIWLQGCNEGTHGLSDTLLSVLSIRGGELVDSMFAEEFRR